MKPYTHTVWSLPAAQVATSKAFATSLGVPVRQNAGKFAVEKDTFPCKNLTVASQLGTGLP